MTMFLNSAICILLSFIVSLFHSSLHTSSVVFLLITISYTTLCYVVQKKELGYVLHGVFLVLAMQYIGALYYMPIFIYTMVTSKKGQSYYILFLLPFVFELSQAPLYMLVIIAITSFVAMELKIQFIANEELKQAYQQQRDATQELVFVLSQKNHDLIIRQNQEIRIATLDERNRIAREIHDNVGHLLSSALLQMGALQTLEKDKTCIPLLHDLKETISTAMDSIRRSVHNLHEEKLDMDAIVKNLVARFTFCPIDYNYEVKHPFSQEVIYHLAAIVKECLHNTMEHSNATRMKIEFREQPAFYQIILHDNGTHIKIKTGGIGLQSMKERIEIMHGYSNITYDDGFKVFISLPREEVYESSHY